MGTGCFGDSFEDDDPSPGSSHNKDRGNMNQDNAITKLLIGMDADEYAALIEAVEAERGPKRPAGVREAAAAYRAGSGEGMRIPSGVSPARLAELVKSANPDTFAVGGDGSSHIDL